MSMADFQYVTRRGYSDSEIELAVRLRAIEWNIWPAYLSQVITPLLILSRIGPVWGILVGQLALGFLWTEVRLRYRSFRLADRTALYVQLLKWPVCIGCACMLIYKHRFITAGLCAMWPILAVFFAVRGTASMRTLELDFTQDIFGWSPEQRASLEVLRGIAPSNRSAK